jgi:hypothetical protein
MIAVLLARYPLKVSDAVVGSHAIFVIDLMAFWPWPYERLANQAMCKNVRALPPVRKSVPHIAAAIIARL